MQNFTIRRNGEHSKADNLKFKLQVVVEDKLVPLLYRIDDYFVNH